MKHAVALLALWLLPAYAVTLTDEEEASCREEGGCVIMTRDRLRQVLDEARREGRRSCGV